MAYQRASWHSGLTYAQICEQCHTKVTYQDNVLDFRPWFADGFVYCPTCRKPLRHREDYAINKPDYMNMAGRAAFCSSCGRAFREEDSFCSACGQKR